MARMKASFNFVAVVLLLAPAILVNCKDISTEINEKEGKILSVFQVVSFPNDICIGSTKNGTCYTQEECSNLGGSSDGSCAEGFGVCCIFTINCGARSSQNCTYFESSGVTAGNCRATVCPCSDTICQLRLDFNTHVLTGPSTITVSQVNVVNGAVAAGPAGLASLATQCLTDSFSVTSPGGGTNPVLCGVNTGEHMYIDASDACNELNFQLGTNAVGVAAIATRSWNIKVTQYDCNSPDKAPAGCTQYFYGSTSGKVRSYNYNAGAGYHLARQNQKICVRRERGNCRICWSTTAETDFAISGGGSDNGKIKTCCGYGADAIKSNYDCVQIPSASKEADSVILGAAGFCGHKGLVSADDGANKSICSKRTPFEIRFQTDDYENVAVELAVANPVDKGFELNYVMSCT